jgi:uncharacterized protein
MSALALALFIAGLASALHCAAMCGGIAAGFGVLHKEALWRRQLAFNLGRITSYSVAGAAAGTVGGYAAAVLPLQTGLYVLASIVLIVAGLHLAGMSLAGLERFGMPLWRRVQPYAARHLQTRPFVAGVAWGWLPCGLVYGALTAAAFAGGTLQGAIAMAAFGAGTLPWLLAAGVAAAKVRPYRRIAGIFLVGSGAWGAAHASGLSETVRQSLICF